MALPTSILCLCSHLDVSKACLYSWVTLVTNGFFPENGIFLKYVIKTKKNALIFIKYLNVQSFQHYTENKVTRSVATYILAPAAKSIIFNLI